MGVRSGRTKKTFAVNKNRLLWTTVYRELLTKPQPNPRYHEGRGKRLKRYGDGWTEDGRTYYKELLTTFQDLKSSEFWNESLQGYWNKYQMTNYGKTSVDYNNKEADIGEDGDDDEDDWKVKAEESDSDIDEGEMSDGNGERRIRAKRI